MCARNRHGDCSGSISRSRIPGSYAPRPCTCPCHTDHLEKYVDGVN